MRIITLIAGLALLPTATFAQQPASQKQASDSDLKTLTVIGCLQEGAQPNQFVLANTADPVSKGVAVRMSGAVPNVTYQLSGGDNLAAHGGHRVEITGKTSGKAQKAATAGETVTTKDVPKGPDTKVEVKEKAPIELRDLKIDSMKMVSTDCAAAR
jgi:hypothetical protein